MIFMAAVKISSTLPPKYPAETPIKVARKHTKIPAPKPTASEVRAP